MTTLRVRQITAKLKQKFERNLDLSDLNQNDSEVDIKILTRCLAAFAVYMETGCSEEEAAESVWDGKDDNGIDAVFYDSVGSRIIIVQSKWIKAGAGEPEAKELGPFADGIKDLVEQESGNFGERLQKKILDVGHAINTPGTTLRIILITTGASELAKHGTAKLDRILEELNGTDESEKLATKRVIGLAEIYPALASSNSQEKIDIDANVLDWSPMSQPYRAFFGIVDGLQLKGWWREHGRRLVAKNIRHSLGATDVNEQIKNTAVKNPENFWYFNNGITLIADEVVKAPVAAGSRASGIFTFKGASIVNGAQTVSTLGRVAEDESLGRVRVPFRVILLQSAPEGFGGEVTRTNNLQNRVEYRDFVAQDGEQARLQTEMAMEGVDYQFLRGSDTTPPGKFCELIEVTTALACASGDPSHAVMVKTGIGRFFIDLKRAPYKSLFNASLSGAKVYNATVVQREIDAWINQKKDSVAKRAGFQWGLLIHGNRILAAAVFRRFDIAALSTPIAEFENLSNSLRISSICERVYERMVSVLEEDYQGRFLAVLFKSPSDSKSVYDKTLAKVGGGGQTQSSRQLPDSAGNVEE